MEKFSISGWTFRFCCCSCSATTFLTGTVPGGAAGVFFRTGGTTGLLITAGLTTGLGGVSSSLNRGSPNSSSKAEGLLPAGEGSSAADPSSRFFFRLIAPKTERRMAIRIKI